MSNEELKKIAETEYQYGFETHIEQETLPPGLDESVIVHISRMKNEPDWLREFRLNCVSFLLFQDPSFFFEELS